MQLNGRTPEMFSMSTWPPSPEPSPCASARSDDDGLASTDLWSRTYGRGFQYGASDGGPPMSPYEAQACGSGWQVDSNYAQMPVAGQSA